MKKIILILLLLPFFANSQVFTSVNENGSFALDTNLDEVRIWHNNVDISGGWIDTPSAFQIPIENSSVVKMRGRNTDGTLTPVQQRKTPYSAISVRDARDYSNLKIWVQVKVFNNSSVKDFHLKFESLDGLKFYNTLIQSQPNNSILLNYDLIAEGFEQGEGFSVELTPYDQYGQGRTVTSIYPAKIALPRPQSEYVQSNPSTPIYLSGWDEIPTTVWDRTTNPTLYGRFYVGDSNTYCHLYTSSNDRDNANNAGVLFIIHSQSGADYGQPSPMIFHTLREGDLTYIQDINMQSNQLLPEYTNEFFDITYIPPSAQNKTALQEETLTKSGYQIFPNPAKSMFTVRIFGEGTMEVRIIDTSGKEFGKWDKTNSVSISTENLPNGIYYVEIENKEGKKTVKQIAVVK